MVIITKNGQRRTVLLNVGAVKDASGKLLHTASVQVDITAQKQIQERLNESQNRLAGIVDSAMDAIIAMDSERRILVFNAAAEKMFGCSAEEAVSGTVDRFVPPRFQSNVGPTNFIDRSMSFLVGLWGLKANGEEFPIEASISQVGTGDKAIFTAIIRDVTERKNAEEALSMVSRRLIEAQEQERTWVARELHDDINQRLAFLAVTLDVVRRELPASAAGDRRRISEVKDQLEDLGQDVQALSHRLHSSKLEYLGLAKAAAAFCREFSERQEVRIEFKSDVIPKTLPSEISLCLFRVLQESLQNSAKHSGSTDFQVLLGYTGDHICLEVRDSGVGFDLEEVMKGAGLGISSMRERLKIVDGELSIDSHLNSGTVIHARVPLGHAAVAVAGKAV
jgi:PAS domain S-box-containing protein